MMFEKDKIYRVEYKTEEMKKPRFAQLRFIGQDRNTFMFSGRPTIGNLAFRPSDIIRYQELPGDVAKATFPPRTKQPAGWF